MHLGPARFFWRSAKKLLLVFAVWVALSGLLSALPPRAIAQTATSRHTHCTGYRPDLIFFPQYGLYIYHFGRYCLRNLSHGR